MASSPPLFTRNFLLLITGFFFQSLGFTSLFLLPLYIDYLGASRSELGTIMAVAPMSGLLIRPALAWGLDILGRKPVVVAGTLFLVSGMVSVAAVGDLGALIYLHRILVGVGIATLFTGYTTWASDLIPLERRTEGMAIFGVAGLFPVAFNAFVHELHVDPPDLRYFFPLVGGLIALSLVSISTLEEPTRAASTRKGQESPDHSYRLGQVLRALCQAQLVPVWLATFIFSGLVALFVTFATVTAESRIGITAGESFWAQPAGLWLPYACAAMGVRIVGGRLPDRLGEHNMVSPALAGYIAAFLLLAGADTPAEFLAAGTLAGVGHGYCFPVLISLAVSRSPQRWRGSAVALYTALWGVTELVLVPLFGYVADLYGDATLYTSATLGALLCMVAWFVIEHRWGPDGTPLIVQQPGVS
ncbi:MAG: MFS transporter [Proteobacteria bacterium]|nr:MFS transporter [Pseudomonadota bacterium]